MKTLRETFLLVLIALAPAALAVAFHPQLTDRDRAGLETGAVRLAEVRQWQPGPLWIDARSAEDFAQQHVPGAILLNEANFDAALGKLLAVWQPGTRIVVYCSSLSCGTSKAVAERLRAAGLDDVHFLHGGWEAWLATQP